ncbi:MAG: glycosyltransferase family 87 protein, partial [Chitinophagaceae bacterium]
LVDVLHEKYYNFKIFYKATQLFWNGQNPYLFDFSSIGLDVFIYGPLFNFAMLPLTWFSLPVGSLLYNIGMAILLVYAIFQMPYTTFKEKKYMYLFILLILLQSIYSSQFNILVAAFFLISFGLLERQKYCLAILLICSSGSIKLYGFSELLLLLLYPNKFKNMLYLIMWLLVISVVPVIRFPLSDLLLYYKSWFGAIHLRHHMDLADSFFRIIAQFNENFALNSIKIIQSIIFGSITLLTTLLYILKRNQLVDKVNIITLIAIALILFGNASEPHTYIISLSMLIYWYIIYFKKRKLLWVHKLFLVIIFICFIVIPIDIFFPSKWNDWMMIHGVNTLFLFICFIYIFYKSIRLKSLLLFKK